MTEKKGAPFRLELAWSIVAALLALGLAVVPLFNVLGYEFSTVFCVFVTISAGTIALRRLNDGTFVLGAQSPAEVYVGTLWRASVPIWAPLAIILLNGLRVRNCDVPVGLALYFLLPVFSVAVVVALVVWTAALVRRPLLRWIGYFTLILVSVSAALWHLATEPAIYAYHMTIGYFAGSIYDEALALPDGLLPFRLYCLAIITLILAGLELAVRRARGERLGGAAIVLVVAVVVAGTIYSQRFELRIESSREAIVEALGGQAESEHFVIYYSLADSEVADAIDAVVADHEYRWSQMVDYFGVEPETPVFSFIYSSQSQKADYMGAGRTLIAKPWLREMHITYDGVGDGHLAHELAHIFTEPFGAGPLSLAGDGRFSIDMGLIEGAATAAAWDGSELTYHGWSAAMYRLDLAPDLVDVIGAGGFWSSYSHTVYTLMGSFCRWLVDEYGMERFREVYGSGDFHLVYGQDIASLVASWRGFLDSILLPEPALEKAEYRYNRPSIFGKPCARSLADRESQAQDLARARRYDDAVECLESVIEDDPDNMRYLLRLAMYEHQAGDLVQATADANAVAERAEAGRVLQAQAHELLGDIEWSHGRTRRATNEYRAVLTEPISDDDARRVWVKTTALEEGTIADTVYSYLLATPPIPRDAMTLLLAEEEVRTGSDILAYLLGLRLFNARDYEGAVSYLDRAIAGFETRDPSDQGLASVLRRARFRRAQSLYLLGEWDAAEDAFDGLATAGDALIDAFAAEAEDWVRRCRWAATGD